MDELCQNMRNPELGLTPYELELRLDEVKKCLVDLRGYFRVLNDVSLEWKVLKIIHFLSVEKRSPSLNYISNIKDDLIESSCSLKENGEENAHRYIEKILEDDLFKRTHHSLD